MPLMEAEGSLLCSQNNLHTLKTINKCKNTEVRFLSGATLHNFSMKSNITLKKLNGGT
jgi:hypothetical protein